MSACPASASTLLKLLNSGKEGRPCKIALSTRATEPEIYLTDTFTPDIKLVVPKDGDDQRIFLMNP